MSADSLGLDLLSEVREEGLDLLLRSLRVLQPRKKQYPFGVPALDSLVSIFHSPPTSKPIQQSVSRPYPRPTQESHAPATQKSRLETKPIVIELAGATACSGKTQVLYHVIARTLFSNHIGNLRLDGREAAVVLFDLSSSFSILRLHDIMQAQATAAASPSALDPTKLSTLIHDSLQHLHIYRPQSLSSLLSALDPVESYLLSNPPAHLSAPRTLGLIAISNLSAFFWPSRLDAEESIDESANPDSSTKIFHAQYRQLVSSLRNLQATFSCPVIGTNMTLSSPIYPALHSHDQRQGAKIRPHMPAVWNNYVTVKLVLQRNTVTKFGPEISMQEAEREREMRWEAVRKAGWRIWLDWWGAEGWSEKRRDSAGWSESEKEAVWRWEKAHGGGIKFGIGRDGVKWEKDEE